jgi:hypothetical protein
MTTTSPTTIPLLENGDKLTRYEFERRYTAMSPRTKGSNKAELIEGIVYMASPLRFGSHAQPHGSLVVWLGNYAIVTPSVNIGIEPDESGVIQSQIFPGLWLAVEAMIAGEMTEVLAVLQAGLKFNTKVQKTV